MTRREARNEAARLRTITGQTHYVTGGPKGVQVVNDEMLKANGVEEHIIFVAEVVRTSPRLRDALEKNPRRKVLRLHDETLADLRDVEIGRKGARYANSGLRQ